LVHLIGFGFMRAMDLIKNKLGDCENGQFDIDGWNKCGRFNVSGRQPCGRQDVAPTGFDSSCNFVGAAFCRPHPVRNRQLSIIEDMRLKRAGSSIWVLFVEIDFCFLFGIMQSPE